MADNLFIWLGGFSGLNLFMWHSGLNCVEFVEFVVGCIGYIGYIGYIGGIN